MTQRYQSCNKQRERESFGIIYQIFSENLSVIEIKRPQTVMNKPVYLGLSILEISKIVMYEFWQDYVKAKHTEKPKLCYMDTDRFLVYT